MTSDQTNEKKTALHGDLAKPIVTAARIIGRDGDLQFLITVGKDFKVVEFYCDGNSPKAKLNKASDLSLPPHTPNSQAGRNTIYALDCTIPIPAGKGMHRIEITHDYEHSHGLILPLNHKTNHDVLDPRRDS